MRNKIIVTILIVLILFQPLFIILKNQDLFFSRTYHARFLGLKKLYYSSQYMIKKNPGIIPDQTLEAFAAGAFIKGLNPILIVHDQPPLGRYITGLSIILFDNENTLTIFSIFTSLFGIFLISKQVLKKTAYSLLPLVIFSNEPLLLEKFTYTPLLELIQLPFIVFSIYFFLRMIKEKKNYLLWVILTVLSLGAVISIRFFILGAVLLVSQLLFLCIKRRFHLLLKFCMVLPLSLVVLILSYTKTIQESGSVLKAFSVQKYILAYHESKFVQLFTVWDLLFFNRWHTWWADNKIITDVNWRFFWPISGMLTICLGLAGIFKKIKLSDPEAVLLLWLACYMFMLSIGYSSTRYLLPVIPFLYILAISFTIKMIQARKHA